MTLGSERDPVIDGKAPRVIWANGHYKRCAARHTATDTTSKFCGDCAKRLKARDAFFKFISRRRDQ
jgi:hypothetical protein